MKARSWLLTAAMVVLPHVGYGAEGLEGKFMMAAQIGTQSEVSGNLMQAAQGTLLSQPISIDSARYRDVYGPDFRYQLLLGYGVSSRSEIIARASYYKTEAAGIEAGTLSGRQLLAFFEPNDYEEVGLELGYRFYFASQTRLKSYIAPIVGVRFLHEILVTLAAQEAGSSITNIPFSKEGSVPVFGADIGFSFDLGQNFFVGVDTGIRYQSAPPQFDYLLGPHEDRRQRRPLDGPGRRLDRVQVLDDKRGSGGRLGSPPGWLCRPSSLNNETREDHERPGLFPPLPCSGGCGAPPRPPVNCVILTKKFGLNSLDADG
jgi:hypothetical protein